MMVSNCRVWVSSPKMVFLSILVAVVWTSESQAKDLNYSPGLNVGLGLDMGTFVPKGIQFKSGTKHHDLVLSDGSGLITGFNTTVGLQLSPRWGIDTNAQPTPPITPNSR